jgi:hypothetical protein
VNAGGGVPIISEIDRITVHVFATIDPPRWSQLGELLCPPVQHRTVTNPVTNPGLINGQAHTGLCERARLPQSGATDSDLPYTCPHYKLASAWDRGRTGKVSELRIPNIFRSHDARST